MPKNCIVCGVKHNNFGKTCKKHDTSPAGTWILSALVELDIFENHDSIENGHLSGELVDDCFGIEQGAEVEVNVDEKDKLLYHMKYRLGEEEDEDECWFENEKRCGKLDFKVTTEVKNGEVTIKVTKV